MSGGELPHERLGEFCIEREVGRGGMGVVFEATQESLGRKVALKVLPSHISTSADALDRFRREAVTAGRLEHPGLAKVYAVGCDKGVHFFAMQLIEGPSLEDCLKKVRGRNPKEIRKSLLEEAGFEPGDFVQASSHAPHFAAAASWMARVAEALACVHQERVLHRDLKPSNIILHPDGSPVLVDFGLAQNDMAATMNRTGGAVGTPSYMSPEQARGRKDLDERADVYGLGATLYELVTLRPPFRGRNARQIMERILSEEAPDPCKINSACPRDLGRVIRKCLRKDREERYSDVAELATDLKRFLRGQAVAARIPTASQREERSVVRRRRAVAASIAATALAVIGAAGFAWFGGRSEKGRAEDHLQQAIDSLVAGDTGSAVRTFLAARKVLGDEAVKQPWLETVRKVADSHTAERRFDEAEKLLGTCVSMYMTDPVVSSWIDNAKGYGSLSLRVYPKGASVELRRIGASGKPVGAAIRSTSNARMPRGEYLVTIDAGEGFEPAVTVVRVQRGGELALELRALPKDLLRPGTVFVLGSGDGSVPSFLIDRTEVTNRQFVRFFKSLPEGERAAFRPSIWQDGGGPAAEDLDKPVRGISHAVAVAYTRWIGGHLPSVEEFARAGNLGASWPFPWGTRFDRARIAEGSEAAVVGSRPKGASPVGCVDLLGNVAEWTHGSDGVVHAQGGGAGSPVASLRLDAVRRLDVSRGHPDVGFRVAYYLPRFADAKGGEKSSRLWARRARRGALQLRSTCRVDARGSVALRYEVAGLSSALSSPHRVFELPGGTTAFAPSRKPTVHASGNIGVTLLGSTQEAMRIRVAAAEKLSPDDRFALSVQADAVVPRQLLVPHHSRRFVHRFRIPKSSGQMRMHTLRIPEHCQVIRTSPSPVDATVEKGELVLTFVQPEVAAQPADEVVEVEFAMDARDGWAPVARGVDAAVRDLAVAWSRGDPGDLAAILADDFAFGPRCVGRGTLLDALGRSQDVARLGPELTASMPILSVTGFGRVSRVVIDTKQEDRPGRRDARMAVTLVATSDGNKVLDLRSLGEADQCRELANGWRNESLRASGSTPSGYRLSRLVGYPTPLQLRMIRGEECIVGRDGTRVACEMLLLACELDSEEDKATVARSLLREAFPMYSERRLDDDLVARVGETGRGASELVLLTRASPGGKPQILQQRVTFERDRRLFVFVASAICETCGESGLRECWEISLAGEFAKMLATLRIPKR